MRKQQQGKAGKKVLPGTIKREEEKNQNSRVNLEGRKKKKHHHATQILLFQAHAPPKARKLKKLLEATVILSGLADVPTRGQEC